MNFVAKKKTILSHQKIVGYKHKSAATSVFMLRQKFQHGTISRKDLCRDKKNSVATLNSKFTIKGNKSLSRQRRFLLRQTKHEVEMNSVTTKKSLSRQEVKKQYKKTVVTKNFMLRHNEELKAESLSRQRSFMS